MALTFPSFLLFDSDFLSFFFSLFRFFFFKSSIFFSPTPCFFTSHSNFGDRSFVKHNAPFSSAHASATRTSTNENSKTIVMAGQLKSELIIYSAGLNEICRNHPSDDHLGDPLQMASRVGKVFHF
jgi:hypothetical protein